MWFQAVIVETIITSILVLLCCSLWDKRNSHNTDGIPVKFGLTVATLAMSAVSLLPYIYFPYETSCDRYTYRNCLFQLVIIWVYKLLRAIWRYAMTIVLSLFDMFFFKFGRIHMVSSSLLTKISECTKTKLLVASL